MPIYIIGQSVFVFYHLRNIVDLPPARPQSCFTLFWFWINNVWFIHTVEYYATTKINHLQMLATKISHTIEQRSQYERTHPIRFCSYHVPKQTKRTCVLRSPDSDYPWEAATRREQEGLLGCWEYCLVRVLTSCVFSTCEKSLTCLLNICCASMLGQQCLTL